MYDFMSAFVFLHKGGLSHVEWQVEWVRLINCVLVHLHQTSVGKHTLCLFATWYGSYLSTLVAVLSRSRMLQYASRVERNEGEFRFLDAAFPLL
jgi:hypothetical protein